MMGGGPGSTTFSGDTFYNDVWRAYFPYAGAILQWEEIKPSNGQYWSKRERFQAVAYDDSPNPYIVPLSPLTASLTLTTMTVVAGEVNTIEIGQVLASGGYLNNNNDYYYSFANGSDAYFEVDEGGTIRMHAQPPQLEVITPVTASLVVDDDYLGSTPVQLSFTIAVVDDAYFVVTLADAITSVTVGYVGHAASVALLSGNTGAGGFTYSITMTNSYFTVDSAGRISLTAAFGQATVLTEAVVVNDTHPGTPPVTLTVSLGVYYAMSFQPPAGTATVSRKYLVTVAAVQATLGNSPYTYSKHTVQSSTDADKITVTEAGEVIITATLSSVDRLTLYVEGSDTDNRKATYAQHIIVREAVRFEPDYTVLTIATTVSGVIYNASAAEGLLPYTYSAGRIFPVTAAITVLADGAVSLAAALSVVQDIRVEINVRDVPGDTAVLTLEIRVRTGGSPNVQTGASVYVIGGLDADDNALADVWVSAADDLQDWDRLIETAAFGARYGHRVVSFNGKLYLSGGVVSVTYSSSGNVTDVEGIKNDVWVSEDAVNWSLLTSAAAFAPRYDHGFIVHDNRMLIIGGEGYRCSSYCSNFLYGHNDVWSSVDGKNWMRIAIDSFYTPYADWEWGRAVRRWWPMKMIL